MKKAYMFPGQGAQFTGMGKELYEGNAEARDLMERANGILGFRLTDIMFEGSDEQLRSTSVTQPAVFLHSVALALSSGLDDPDMTGGHSLGEFSALAAAGVLGFEDGLKLVAARAEAMQKCCVSNPGTMAAIIGLEDSVIEEICLNAGGLVVPANYNSPGQLVVSGEAGAVNEVCESAKQAGAKLTVPLNVGGAFHSPLMEEARVELAKAIEATSFSVPRCPVYQNVSAKAENDPQVIKSNLLKQLTSPVLWTQSVKSMLADGVTEFIEIGPGKTLQGLVKRIAPRGSEILIKGIC